MQNKSKRTYLNERNKTRKVGTLSITLYKNIRYFEASKKKKKEIILKVQRDVPTTRRLILF